MKDIKADVLKCRGCTLCNTVTNKVFGDGNECADILFLGEAPGEHEDKQGKPFIGQAGKLLTNIVSAMNFKRDDVYICNTVKCRPPQNRNPSPEEIKACNGFLTKQLEYVKPKVIVALGTFAAQTLLKTQTPISKLRGKTYTHNGAIVVPTFHPSYLLRNPAAKSECWKDMQIVMEKMK